MNCAQDIFYVGVNDHETTLFEGQFPIPQGISYNSYVIKDEKIAVMDSVDARFAKEWLGNIQEALAGATPDYLVVQHMEPDHSGSIDAFMSTYPDAQLVCNAKSAVMIEAYFGDSFASREVTVKNNEELVLGTHTLQFVFTPMVHWPEVMMTFDDASQVLFTADAFGRFGALDVEQDWDDEARRYYWGIVAPYGKQVQGALKKILPLDVKAVYPLHGPILTSDLPHYVKLYQTWAAYEPEQEGVTIAFASVYGHTKVAAEKLAEKLEAKGCAVTLCDLVHEDQANAVARAFQNATLVCAAPTYNGGVFPAMRNFLADLAEKKFQNRTVAFIENGSWAPMATKAMKAALEGCKNLTFVETKVSIKGSVQEAEEQALGALAEALA